MKYFLLIIILFSSLSADTASFTVDAKEMEYDGKTQTLKARDVAITFKNGSKLSSRSAMLDFESMNGLMSSGTGGELVTYTGFFTSDDQVNHPVVVKGRKMTIEISRNEEDPSLEIIQVTAEQEVEIKYDDDYTAYGDLATFVNEETENRNFLSATSSGVLSLEGDLCRIEHRNGDIVEAVGMWFHPKENFIEGRQVSATLTSLGRFREVELRANEMHWAPKEGYLCLREESDIVDRELGSISNVGTIKCYQDQSSGKTSIRKVVAVGKTRIIHLDHQHVIGCLGELILDNENEILTMKSLENKQQDLSHQAFYEDKMGRIFADEFKIKYHLLEGTVQPHEVIIDGRVRMHNRYVSDPAVRSFLEQYALADKVKYSPKTKEMYCTASKGKRVLYYDKTQGIQLSAPGLFVHRRPDEELEVQGRGNVRLKFTQSEIDIIKQYFPFLL